MTASDELPILPFASQAEWEGWLDENGASASGVWLEIAKKASGVPTVSTAEAVESALCFGWIDGQARPFDDRFWLQRFTPRRRRSKWSEINRTRALELIEQGRMRPAGLAEVERARADGRWDAAYAPPSRAIVPPDLQAELDADPAARAFFQALDGQSRYAIIYRLGEAKRPETRARRLGKFVAMLKAGEKLHP